MTVRQKQVLRIGAVAAPISASLMIGATANAFADTSSSNEYRPTPQEYSKLTLLEHPSTGQDAPQNLSEVKDFALQFPGFVKHTIDHLGDPHNRAVSAYNFSEKKWQPGIQGEDGTIVFFKMGPKGWAPDTAQKDGNPVPIPASAFEDQAQSDPRDRNYRPQTDKPLADKILNEEEGYEKKINQDYDGRIAQAPGDKSALEELRQSELSALHQTTDARIPQGAREARQQQQQSDQMNQVDPAQATLPNQNAAVENTSPQDKTLSEGNQQLPAPDQQSPLQPQSNDPASAESAAPEVSSSTGQDQSSLGAWTGTPGWDTLKDPSHVPGAALGQQESSPSAPAPDQAPDQAPAPIEAPPAPAAVETLPAPTAAVEQPSTEGQPVVEQQAPVEGSGGYDVGANYG